MTDFHASSRLPRWIAALAATLCTVLTLTSVLGLAMHYESIAPTQMAVVDTSRPA